jgi:anti-sigma regulatory factor (Ser/Thr protein kinase)
MAAGEQQRRRFPGRADQVAPARRFVTAAFDPDDPTYEAARLLVSEAVTNALLHSGSGLDGGTFEVSYTRRQRRLRVEVRDDGAPTGPRRRVHHPESMTGRGMELFDVLASRWGVEGGPAGRTLWFELDDDQEMTDAAAGGAVRSGSPRAQPGPLGGGPAGGPTARAAA